ncbi:MAG: sulfurtransferase TusA family protein [Candidatus Hodarchaeales archaeon]
MKISKPRMAFKFLKMFFWRIIKRKWYMPGVPEITVDQLAERLKSNDPPLILDLRDRADFEGMGDTKYTKHGHIQGAKWIPIMELSSLFDEIPKDKEIITICPGGGMSLVAAELLINAGFTDAKSLKGGIWEWAKNGYPLIKGIEATESPSEEIELSTDKTGRKIIEEAQSKEYLGEIDDTVDARDLLCPRPVLMSKKALNKLEVGQVLEILTTDPGSCSDIPAWAHVTSQELLSFEERGSKSFRFLVKKLH